MKKNYGLKSILASILVTAALVSPAVVLSSGANISAELTFQGAKLRYCDDGSVQAIFSVSIDKSANLYGASFNLKYNENYLIPSDFNTNQVVLESGQLYTDAFFTYNGADNDPYANNAPNDVYLTGATKPLPLYKPVGDKVNPFRTQGQAGVDNFDFYSSVDTSEHVVNMHLELDQNLLFDHVALDQDFEDYEMRLLTEYGASDDPKRDYRYVFNKKDELDWEDWLPEYNDNQAIHKVVLGYLSFRVEPEKLPEIFDYFNGLDVESDHTQTTPTRPVVALKDVTGNPTTETTFLLDILYQDGGDNKDTWQILGYGGRPSTMYPMQYNPDRSDDNIRNRHNVVDHYIFGFDANTIIDVRATDSDFELNAYQAYTGGDVDDLALALGRYTPTVTVTYADGRQENIPFPWGRSGAVDAQGDPVSSQYTYQAIDPADVGNGVAWKDKPHHAFAAADYEPNATDGAYGTLDHGTDYFITQKYQTYKKNADGTYQRDANGHLIVDYTFPKDVWVHMRVTPVQLLEVTAQDLEKTYLIDEVLSLVQGVGDLDLPGQAQLITDVVPGGVSMVMPIKGWRGAHPDSTWPAAGAANAMNALKADSYTAANGYPFWPDTGDAGSIAATPERHLGTYSFESADKPGGTAEGILKVDIVKEFPWLTVGQDSYALPQAKRHIVDKDHYVGVDKYQVSYVSTVTQTPAVGGGAVNGDGQPTLTLRVERADSQSLTSDSVFRVWLPNGLEIGTGLADGLTAPVDDWFNNDTEGFYRTEAQTDTGATKNNFKLITNPDDPTQGTPAWMASRETLRRYINLGGWYEVAICENPGDAEPTWTERIPVYVPPRRNEYQQDKVYNFVAENRTLFNWPGWIQGGSATVTLPRGDYAPLAPMATADDNGDVKLLGIPLYEDAENNPGVILNGVDNTSDVYADGTGANTHQIKEGIARYQESYGVQTTYDGQTGAQPGEIFTLTVDNDHPTANAWTPAKTTATTGEHLHQTVEVAPPLTTGSAPTVTPTTIYRYGPAALMPGYDDAAHGGNANGTFEDHDPAEGVQVMGFGRVYQPYDDSDRYQVTLRRDTGDGAQKQLKEHIRLTCDSDRGIQRVVQSDKNSNVTVATYDDQTEGYTVRQTYTLTITNDGEVDIYGLNIDGLTDGYNGNPSDPVGGRFEMLQAPATFLPVGESTTFVLTYVYDLKANEAPNTLVYRDKLYITSTTHPTAKYGGTNQENHAVGDNDYDYLLDFDAEFTVDEGELHKVTVIYKPEHGRMGTAGLIVGERQVNDPDNPGSTIPALNYTSTTRTYPEGNTVYVAAYLIPDEEYTIRRVTCVDDATGATVAIYDYTQKTLHAELDPDTGVYYFEMPDADVTVTVEFEETTYAKLRLTDLIDYSAPQSTDLKQDMTDPVPASDYVYPVWQKQYTDAELSDALARAGANQTRREELYLSTMGSAVPYDPDPAKTGQRFKPSWNQYLVVIDPEDDRSQVEITLRKVIENIDYREEELLAGGSNLDITNVNVLMELYEPTLAADMDATAGAIPNGTVVYDGNTTVGYGPRPATTATPSVHTTVDFLSPDPGASKYVRVTLTAADEYTGTPVSRYYYLEIHRRTADAQVVMSYGNSPYGMIMNEGRYYASGVDTDASQKAAKAAFVEGYTFRGLSAANVPDVAQSAAHPMNVATYWREAWVKNRQLFEPESYTGFIITPNAAAPEHPNVAYDPAVYVEADNLDLNDYAFFAILGEDLLEPGIREAKDSAGRPVHRADITATIKDVVLLDATATAQVARFSGTQTVDIDLGASSRQLTAVPATAPATLNNDYWPVQATETTDPVSGETTTTWTKVENIRPGRYVLRYTYLDFDGNPANALHVDRDIVILPPVGDVNVDGVRTSVARTAGKYNSGNASQGTDEYVLEHRVTDPLGYEAGGWDSLAKAETTYPYANIFKFRACDVNNDRNVNNIDGNLIDENVKAGEGWLRFYHPYDYGRRPLPAENF